MIEKLRDVFVRKSERRVPDSETEFLPDPRERRKNRITGHLDNMRQAQKRLETLQVQPLSWLPFNRQLMEGGFAGTQMLLGVVAVPSGIVLRQREPIAGAILTYHGMNMLLKGASQFSREFFLFFSRSHVDKRRGLKKTKKGAAGHELMSERSTRTKMKEIAEATQERQKEFREYRLAYRKMREAGVIPQDRKGEAYENYLRGYSRYLDELIDGQTKTIEGESTVKGLAELSKTFKDYYQGLIAPNQEAGDVGAVAGATGTLLGQALFHRSPLTIETIIALSGGVLTAVGDVLERAGVKESTELSIGMFDRELQGLKDLRLEKVLELERRMRRRMKREAAAHVTAQAATSIPDQTGFPTPSRAEADETANFFDQLQAAMNRIIHGAPEDLGALFPVAEEQPILPVGSVPAESPQRAITPPPFDEIESSSLRREVDPKIIVDLMNIAGRELKVPTSSIGWVDAPSVVSSVFVEEAGHDISEEVLDEAIRYLDELDDRLTAHNSVRNFQHEHLARLIAMRGDMRVRLYSRERAKYRELILRDRPSSLRAAILRRSRIADFSDEAIEDISQEQFEGSIRQWMRRESTRSHDRSSLRRFLEACQETLDAIPSHVPTRDEKARIVKRVGDVLDEFLPEVSMPDPEQVAAWNRRIDEIAALFNRAQLADDYDKRQRVPELLAGEDFVPSDVLREVTFAKGDLGDMKIKSVDTTAVVGSYVDREAWIVQDRARIAELAAPLINTPTPEAFQKFFVSEVIRGDQTRLEENIQLLRIPGPKGPIYFAYRGIQHIAAARVAGLPRIVARVYEVRPRDLVGNKIFHTKYRDRYEEWLRLNEAGLIDGELVSAEKLKSEYAWFTPQGSDRQETLTPIEAKIRHQAVPWLVWFNLNPDYGAAMRSIPEISRLYHKLYAPPKGSTETGPFDKLKKSDGTKLNPLALTSDAHFTTFILSRGKRLA